MASGLVFGFTASIAAIATCSALFWAFNNPINLVQLGVIANLLLVGFGLVVNKQGLKLPLKHSRVIDVKDICALLVVAFSVTLYISSSYKLTGSFSPKVDAVQNTTKALDDQNHFVMFRDTVAKNNGLLLGNDSIYKPNTLLSVYPKGSHTAAAVLAEAGRGLWAKSSRTAPGSVDELYVYAFIKALFYAMTIYALTRFALEVAGLLISDKGTKNKFGLIPGLFTSVLCAYIATIYLTPLFMDGAFSFVPIFLFAPFFLLAYSDIVSNKKYLGLIIILGLIAAASTLMWTIAGFPYFLLLAIVVGRLFLLKKPDNQTVMAVAVLALCGLLGLVQVYVQLTSKVAVLSVNTQGGFYTFPLLIPLIFIAFVLWGGRTLETSSNSRTVYRASLFLIAIFTLICAVISLYNFKDSGEVQYYFTKLLYFPFVVLTFLAAGIATNVLIAPVLFLKHPISQPTKLLSIFDESMARITVFVLCLSALFIAFPPNLAVIDYMVKGHRSISKSTAAVLIKELESISKSESEAIFLLSDKVSHFENIMATHTLNASNQGSLCQGTIFDSIYSQEQPMVFTSENIDKCIKFGASKIKILTNSDIFDKLPDEFKHKIEIEVIKV